MKSNKCFFFCLFGSFVFVCFVCADSSRQLSFEQRVAYQKAIEEVHWSHTIWPAENPQPKPRLEQVMSEKDIRLKVSESLRKSTALTGAQLQMEMNRIAADTRDAQLLHEVWNALGNNPYLIAECFARPVLAERFADHLHGGLPKFPVYNYTLPLIKEWNSFNTSALQVAATAPSARFGHTAVWTGTAMIIWGGSNGTADIRTGRRYNPSTNSWAATNKTGAPSARQAHTAVWTGTEMIIWGGSFTGSGGRYNPATNSWTATSGTEAPSRRSFHTAVWTGTHMIIWGGCLEIVSACLEFDDGGRYNPSTNSWKATKTIGAPSGRYGHTAVWTGTQMIIWGGQGGLGRKTTGGRYNPSSNSWVATSTAGVPEARTFHTAVWTGTAMIVWGGSLSNAINNNTGGRYNPTTDSWKPTTTANAPYARDSHTAVWTGTRMIVWGGNFVDVITFRTGGRYNPSTDSWESTRTAFAPSARERHTAVWTGTEMIIWGGSFGSIPTNTGGRYSLSSNAWTATAQ